MAAKIPRAETRYFKERLQPLIDGDHIKLVGELNDDAKGDLLRGASALLFPIDWPEPFGLVMIEAMACGTPVIAYRRGSVPEVVDEGVTGFVVDNKDEAIAAVQRIGDLDRRTVRATFETRFGARRMAKDYLGHYEALLQAETRRALEPVRMLSAG
jgi:glycosyltransferase involved in cell wall biosynthesis